MRYLIIFIVLAFTWQGVLAQSSGYQRTGFNAYYGFSGGTLLDFNELLEDRGADPMPNGYKSYGLGYQTRFNDFIIGAELYQNNGMKSSFGDYEMDYRTTRGFVSFGYSFTEEGRFQLIHYMSIGLGYLNFQMLQDREEVSLGEFLEQPARGYILRRNDVTKGSQNLGGFLTEIGFELGYDLDILPREEVLSLMAKVGYSFNPFEESWKINNMNFDNLQSGAFVRLGAGISLPEGNYFYRDASLGFHVFYGQHFTKPNALNNLLEEKGYRKLSGTPYNIGLKILGENRGTLYGLDLFNLSMSGEANETYVHNLNSLRIYGNFGKKLFDLNNWELGVTGGLGYANIRYTMLHKYKIGFPEMIDLPDYDGELKNAGAMAKPEVYFSYASPLSKKTQAALVYTLYGGYEVPLARYRLADQSMAKYMAGPYLQLGVGIRP
ncbi:hypothetical protein GCM10028791_01590 [Echinicola sediminis]